MKHKAAGWKFLVPLILGILIMSVAFVLISYHTFRDVEIQDYADYAKGLNGLIAKDIVRVDDIDGYLEQGRDYPGYGEIERKLSNLREAYPDVVYLYVYQFREDGAHVVFDLDTAEYKGSEPGSVERFFPAFESLIPDLLAGKPVPPVESHEQYGYVLSVLTPLYDETGICKAYVGADCSMDRLTDYVWNIIRQIACVFLVVLGLALIASVVMTNIGVKRMKGLENRAYIDTLTGLQNRTAYYDYNNELNKKLDEGRADFSILMIDINWLKKMNDTYGHEQGNLYLQGAANLIRSVFGDDHLYRIGGDEFVIILEGKAQEGTEDRIRKFKEEIARLQADESLKPWEKISAAVGLARYEKGVYRETEEVLRKADEVMYADKMAMKAVRTD
ncbi:MAG: GGDEF domain-containing protein [Clostridiales bacterium]|nr:GGDEF domain-containing protein [Clostridiales bacterium]